MSPRDRLIAAELQASVGEGRIGRRILVLESTSSTNDFLLRMLTPELPEGFVVFAEHQTGGRGQRGNRWDSAPHLGLWFSFLLRLNLPLTESARLTEWTAKAIARTVARETGLEPRIKPPNDVYVGERKVSGVLVETTSARGRITSAIVGVGVNVNQQLEDFPMELRDRAGSLAMGASRPIDRSGFAIELLRELNRVFAAGAEAGMKSTDLPQRDFQSGRRSSRSC